MKKVPFLDSESRRHRTALRKEAPKVVSKDVSKEASKEESKAASEISWTMASSKRGRSRSAKNGDCGREASKKRREEEEESGQTPE